MKVKVESGEYLLGDLVEPKTFTKSVLDHSGNITQTTYTVHARRIPLDTLRIRIYKEHKKLGISELNHNFDFYKVILCLNNSLLISDLFLSTTCCLCPLKNFVL